MSYMYWYWNIRHILSRVLSSMLPCNPFGRVVASPVKTSTSTGRASKQAANAKVALARCNILHQFDRLNSRDHWEDIWNAFLSPINHTARIYPPYGHQRHHLHHGLYSRSPSPQDAAILPSTCPSPLPALRCLPRCSETIRTTKSRLNAS